MPDTTMQDLADLCGHFRKARMEFLDEHKKDLCSEECITAYDKSEAIRANLMEVLAAMVVTYPDVFESMFQSAAKAQK